MSLPPAWQVEIRKQGNLDITLVGPESVGCGAAKCDDKGFAASELAHFLKAENHADGQPPEMGSFHAVSGGLFSLIVRAAIPVEDNEILQGCMIHAGGGEAAMGEVEDLVSDPEHVVQQVEALKRRTGQATKMTINEFMNFVADGEETSV
jgi:hypothetical protein